MRPRRRAPSPQMMHVAFSGNDSQPLQNKTCLHHGAGGSGKRPGATESACCRFASRYGSRGRYGFGFAIRGDRPAEFAGAEIGVSQIVIDGPVAKSVGEQRFQKRCRLVVIGRCLGGIKDLESHE